MPIVFFEARDGWEMRVNFNLPLFDGGSTEGHRTYQDAELARLQLELIDVQKQISVEARRAY